MVINQFSNNKDALISVLLPISRLDDYFDLALSSILNQTYSNFELLVLANGITDDEYTKIAAKCAADSRVTVYRLRLRGLVFALNYGIEKSSGTLIARMDADDISVITRFEVQSRFLSENPDYGVVGGRIKLIDESGRVIGKSYKFYGENEDICKVLPYRNPLCHPALMFRKDTMLKVFGYKYGFMSEDHEMFIRMMLVGVKFKNLDSDVLQYRRHSAQITDISRAGRHFSEISAFMWMHFYNTKRLGFLLGALAVYPVVRRIRQFALSFRR